MVYFNSRRPDVLLNNCSRDLTDKRLLQFFKPMDPVVGRRMRYGLYDESEWRIIAGACNQLLHHQIIDPRNTTNPHIVEYFDSLSQQQQEKLKYLVPLDGWLAAIIYPSMRIKNKAQEDGGEIQILTRKIAKTPDHAHAVEGDNIPVELDLDRCMHF